MFSRSASILLALVALNVSLAAAFQQARGPDCPTGGEACTYSYVVVDPNTNEQTTINASGFCSPLSLKCLDNGAVCETDDNCFNYCGSTGICGGPGALCNSQGSFETNTLGITCATPGTSCTADGSDGTCKLSASLAARAKARARRAAAHAAYDGISNADHLEKIRRAMEIVKREGDEIVA